MSGTAAPIARVLPSTRVMDRGATDLPGKLCFFFLCLFTVAIYARP